MRIPECPSFVHCNWWSRSGRDRRQAATLPRGENWILHSEYHRRKHFVWFGVLVLSHLVVLSCWDNRQQFLLWLGLMVFRRPNTASPTQCVPDGGAMSNLQSIGHCWDIGGGGWMMLMSVGWGDHRDGKCRSDLDLPGVVIPACLGQVAHVGKVVLGGCVVAESAMDIVRGFHLLGWDSIVPHRQRSWKFLGLVDRRRSLCP